MIIVAVIIVMFIFIIIVIIHNHGENASIRLIFPDQVVCDLPYLVHYFKYI